MRCSSLPLLLGSSPDGDPDDGRQDEDGHDWSYSRPDEAVDLVPAGRQALVELSRQDRRQDRGDELQDQADDQQSGDDGEDPADDGTDTVSRVTTSFRRTACGPGSPPTP